MENVLCIMDNNDTLRVCVVHIKFDVILNSLLDAVIEEVLIIPIME